MVFLWILFGFSMVFCMVFPWVLYGLSMVSMVFLWSLYVFFLMVSLNVVFNDVFLGFYRPLGVLFKDVPKVFADVSQRETKQKNFIEYRGSVVLKMSFDMTHAFQHFDSKRYT